MHKATLQGKMQFVVRSTFCPLSKFSRCKEYKSLLFFHTRKLIERVDGKAHRFSLCALPCTCATNFRVTKDRRDFYSLQRENVLSGKKVIRTTNCILPCNVVLCTKSYRKILLVLLGLKLVQKVCREISKKVKLKTFARETVLTF